MELKAHGIQNMHDQRWKSLVIQTHLPGANQKLGVQNQVLEEMGDQVTVRNFPQNL